MVKSVNKDWNPVWKHGQILRTTFFCGIFYECGGGVADTIFHRDHLSSSYSFSILKIAFPNFPLSSLFNPIFSHNKSYPSPEYFFKDFDRTLNMRFHHHHHSLTMGLFSFPVQGREVSKQWCAGPRSSIPDPVREPDFLDRDRIAIQFEKPWIGTVRIGDSLRIFRTDLVTRNWSNLLTCISI